MKLPGVESAVVSLDKASADIRLKPDNAITMTQLRDVLKKNGYPTRDAQIEARGRIVDRNGGLVLDLLNGSVMEVVLDAAVGQTRLPQLPVDVHGVSRLVNKTTEKLTVTSVDAVKF